MQNIKRIICALISLCLLLSFAACSEVDNSYGVSSEKEISTADTAKAEDDADVGETPIMSSDRVMSKYFDISLFDEENYADIYLGKKFKIDARFMDGDLEVPNKLSELAESGWTLAEGNIYDKNALVFAYETVDALFVNENGVTIAAQLYNSSRSTVKLSECYVVKFRLENDFYTNSEDYKQFNINGITNTMALTDIINTLGTPSHFYKVSDTCYYLDYFITKKDRRNGITVYINPVEDMIMAIEFSYYK
ncbi:MAG: hypothetical protein IKD04_07375 [Clostridia bacterium]|nr:hypothetical protein [Clostridia bacterium]